MKRSMLALLCVALLGGCASRGSGAPDATSSDAVTTHGEWIRIARGSDSIRAYMAFPERSDRAPAIIVIHENQGLSQWEPTVADRLAKAGYVALAPDLLSSRFGATPATGDSARRLIGQLSPDGVPTWMRCSRISTGCRRCARATSRRSDSAGAAVRASPMRRGTRG